MLRYNDGGRDTVAHGGSRRAQAARLLCAVLSLAVVSVLVLTGSRAAFSDTTISPDSGWAAGEVVLTDDGGESALFSVSNMKPGQTVQRCITVTYSGSLEATVRLYGSVTGALASYLDLAVEVGEGGSFPDCSGFIPQSMAYNGTLQGFGDLHSDFGSGVTGFAAPVSGTAKTFRFVATLRDDNDAQGRSADATFTWEAQSS